MEVIIMTEQQQPLYATWNDAPLSDTVGRVQILSNRELDPRLAVRIRHLSGAGVMATSVSRLSDVSDSPVLGTRTGRNDDDDTLSIGPELREHTVPAWDVRVGDMIKVKGRWSTVVAVFHTVSAQKSYMVEGGRTRTSDVRRNARVLRPAQ